MVDGVCVYDVACNDDDEDTCRKRVDERIDTRNEPRGEHNHIY